MSTPCGVDWIMAKESISVDFGNYLLDAVHYLLLRKRSCAMVTFLSRNSFFGLQTSCTGAANLPLMSGAGVVHSWEGQACLAVRTQALIASALEAFFPSCRAFCSDIMRTVK